MSISITLHCNRDFGHGTCATSLITAARSLEDARATAHTAGWGTDGDHDYCPGHAGHRRPAASTVVALHPRTPAPVGECLGPGDTIHAAITHLRATAAATEDELAAPYWQNPQLPREYWFAAGVENALGGPAGKLAGLLDPATARHLVRLLQRTTRTARAGIPVEAFLVAHHITRNANR
ncbi:hypothetical protein ACWDO7_22910 [Streptomyces sp. NPDC003656]